MTSHDLDHLELNAEVDSLSERLRRWIDQAPDWEPADVCRAVVRRLIERTDTLRVRLESPLVVATLGGTGTGKSTLVNALVGADVTETGRQRPTTRRPRLICRPSLKPEMLGIAPEDVELLQRDLPALTDLVLIDCPDPDTTEDPDGHATNLTRLRAILPHCDVILVTTTQQKYRSARVAGELAAAATGARLVFVQTHADTDEDVRNDWREHLQDEYATGQVFLVDSLQALADAQAGMAPRGEFAGLVDLLIRQLGGSASVRIRRANYLDLLAEALRRCSDRIAEHRPAVERLGEAILERRIALSARLGRQMRQELLTSRRPWESRLVGKAASRWGFSPFSLVLRAFQGMGGLLTSTLLLRARTPAQIALWGAVEGVRRIRSRGSERDADRGVDRAVSACFDDAALREASMIIDGYAAEAAINRQGASHATLAGEAEAAGDQFIGTVAQEVETLLDRVAARHTGWFTRWWYEILLLLMLGFLLYRAGRNFFYDQMFAPGAVELHGLSFYALSAIWLIAWCGLLLWMYTGRLRRGLRRQIDDLAQSWQGPEPAAGLFTHLESECDRVERFSHDLDRLKQHVARLRHELELPDKKLGRRK